MAQKVQNSSFTDMDAAECFPANASQEEQIDFITKKLNLSYSPSQVKLKKMSGGITNSVYMFDAPSKKFIVRVYGRNTEQIIDRTAEQENIKKIDLVKIYSSFPNGMICSYQEGRQIDVLMMADAKISEKIAVTVARMHRATFFENNHSNEIFERLGNFIAKLDPTYSKNGERIDIPDLQKRYNRLKSELELEMSTSSVALCHNDLLAGNILWDGEKIGIVDYEYSGFGWPEFDIANHFFEWCGFELDMSRFPSAEQQERFIRAYLTELFGQEPEDSLVRQWIYRVNLLVKLSGLFWGCWGYFQASNSTVNFPYYEYAKHRVELTDYDLPLPADHPLAREPLMRV